MAKYNYSGDSQFRPLSPWGYFGYQILFSIPILGFIFLVVFALSDSNINRRNFARSYFCIVVVVLVIVAIIVVTGAASTWLTNLAALLPGSGT